MSATLLAQFGEGLTKQLEAKCRSTSTPNTSHTPERAAPCVAEPRSSTAQADGTTTVADTKGRTMLECIQNVTGIVRAYDGRYCVWGSNGPFDIRDVARRLGVHHMDIVEALPEFKPVRRGKRGSDDDSTETD